MKAADSDIFMTTVEADPALQAALRTLDAQAGQYSVATQMRLNEARARAIAATRAKIPFWRNTPLLAAAFALSAAYTFVILIQPVILTQTHTEPTSAELEATALYEATFGADAVDESNPAAFFDAKLAATALDETDLDETVVANELEFYAWLSETSAQRTAPANAPGSGS